jgi:hypothetical protein
LKLEEELSLPGDTLRQEIRKQLQGKPHKITEKGKTNGIDKHVQEQLNPADSAEKTIGSVLQKPEGGKCWRKALVPRDFSNEVYRGSWIRSWTCIARGEKLSMAKVFDRYRGQKNPEIPLKPGHGRGIEDI